MKDHKLLPSAAIRIVTKVNHRATSADLNFVPWWPIRIGRSYPQRKPSVHYPPIGHETPSDIIASITRSMPAGWNWMTDTGASLRGRPPRYPYSESDARSCK